ncbi:MAG: pyridoxal phosphate-dependent aminotransferase [Syntrophaceae bacterium]|nr:pyridoxal phosphate-dependent aminotransferase [Syntrophaceae bacterium]
MKNLLSQRASELKPSATLAISAKEKELKGQGIDVVGFGAGEPDFSTPIQIREAAKKSLDNGETFYTPVGGSPQLKNAIIKRFRADYGLEYKPEHILVSCGAKHSLYNIFQAIINPGDEVLIPAPYWVSYPEMVSLSGGTPIIVPSYEKQNFEPDVAVLESLITQKTKALLVNSPSNPTGIMYSRKLLEALAALAEKYDLLVISDEIYDKLIYDKLTFTPFASLPGMHKRTITVNGVSKTYAMTGFRIGYLAAPVIEIVKAATDIQSQSTSNPCATAQAAAIEALSGPQDEVEKMRQIFEKRRNLMVDLVNDIPELFVLSPQGAFYTFVNTSKLNGKNGIKNSTDFANLLLEKYHVACVPGGPFGSEDHIRLSFATSDQVIEEGIRRIGVACKDLG